MPRLYALLIAAILSLVWQPPASQQRLHLRADMDAEPWRPDRLRQYGAAGAQRKAWFQRLKKDYPASRWAQALKFYW